ncbi:MAG: diiron oxygenase [Nocardiopsaceae bacterium]|nr:diiron oxygenase [Nocardiopsaceae bacterium]
MTSDATAKRLLNSSAKNSYDPDIDIDWDAPLPDDKLYMPAERISLYGTELWEKMTPEQRTALSKHEISSLIGTGIWFELILMQMLVRHAFRRDPQDPSVQYALTEIGDETRHVQMFARSLQTMGVPTYRPGRAIDVLARIYKATAWGPSLFAPVLVAEETLDRYQRSTMNDESIQPAIRMVNRIHVTEEARHVRFAREEIARVFPALSPLSKTYHQLLTAVVAAVIVSVLISRDVYSAAGLDPDEALRAAHRNPYHHETKRWMGEKIMSFLSEQGMVPWFTRPIYRLVHLL